MYLRLGISAREEDSSKLGTAEWTWLRTFLERFNMRVILYSFLTAAEMFAKIPYAALHCYIDHILGQEWKEVIFNDMYVTNGHIKAIAIYVVEKEYRQVAAWGSPFSL